LEKRSPIFLPCIIEINIRIHSAQYLRRNPSRDNLPDDRDYEQKINHTTGPTVERVSQREVPDAQHPMKGLEVTIDGFGVLD